MQDFMLYILVTGFGGFKTYELGLVYEVMRSFDAWFGYPSG